MASQITAEDNQAVSGNAKEEASTSREDSQKMPGDNNDKQDSTKLPSWSQKPKSEEEEVVKQDDNNNDDNTSSLQKSEEEVDDEQPELTFPQQLMEAIESESTSPNGVIIQNSPDNEKNGKLVLEWGEKGNSFIIRDKTLFEREVVSKYFNVKCKFMSFVRKLYR